MEILLETKNLSIEYKSINDKSNSNTLAVDNVSFKLLKGEIYALAGESGCGKSSLAKSIVKLVQPKSGDILYEGKSIFNQNILLITNINFVQYYKMLLSKNSYSPE